MITTNVMVGLDPANSLRFLRTSTRWCPSSLAKLVNITPIKPMVYGRYNYILFMG